MVSKSGTMAAGNTICLPEPLEDGDAKSWFYDSMCALLPMIEEIRVTADVTRATADVTQGPSLGYL